MDSSVGAGFMAVFAVSGSVVLLALQVHKRLLSDFMKKIDFELERHDQPKKRVRFADDVVEPSSNNKEYRKRHLTKLPAGVDCWGDPKLEDTMPPNWQALYKGIIQYRTFKGHNAAF